MSNGFTLEHYRFDAKPVSREGRTRHDRLWSREVAADLVAAAEACAVVIGGLLPSAIYAAAGVIEPNWFITVQSALLAALVYRLYLASSGIYSAARSNDFAVHSGHMLVALLFSISVALGLGAPAALGGADLAVWFTLWLSASYTFAVIVRTVASDIVTARTAEGRFDERIAVYGAGLVARRVHDYLTDPALGLRFTGVFDSRELREGANRGDAEGLELSGGLDDLLRACREGRVDRVIIALPQIAEQRVRELGRKFEDLSVHVHIVTHLSTDYVGVSRPHRVSQLGPVGLMAINTKRHSGWSPIVKRIEDLVIGSIAVVVIAPLVPLIALAIKLESPGPVLFRQRRRGRHGHVFEVLKFRTMRVMEDGAEVRQVTSNDARVTWVGHVLRRTSLDELPQIWNVLKGDMSLVGPRPHAMVHDETWGQMLETYANRHQMKPGVTGLAQVRGFRGEAKCPEDIEARVNSDLAYIRGWSLWLDLEILFKTVWAVVRGTNAK